MLGPARALLFLVLAGVPPSLPSGAAWGRTDGGVRGLASTRGRGSLAPPRARVPLHAPRTRVQRLRGGAGPDAVGPVAAEAGDEGATEAVEAGGSAAAEGETMQEGLARFHGTLGGKVFYNRVMVVNRDLSVLVLRWFVGQHAREMEALHLRRLERLRNASLSTNGINATAPGGEPGAADSGLLDNATAAPERKVHVLDAMSATGLRAIRYALEVPEVGSITANDKDPDAVEAIRSNVALSQVPDGKVHAVESDAVSLMLARAGAGELFDFIDLDPFGSPAALLSAALHALRPGGMLAVTATDMRVLCGNQPEVCFSRYGSMSLRGPYAKEMAIRILLHAIRTAAAPLGRTVEPVVSVYMDFYVRVFVRVWPNRAGALRTCLHSGNVVHCQSCHTFSLQPNAVLTHNRRISVAYASALSPRGDGSEAGHDREAGGAGAGAGGACCGVGPFLFGGPVWLGKLQSPDVVLSLRNALRERSELVGKCVCARSLLLM